MLTRLVDAMKRPPDTIDKVDTSARVDLVDKVDKVDKGEKKR